MLKDSVGDYMHVPYSPGIRPPLHKVSLRSGSEHKIQANAQMSTGTLLVSYLIYRRAVSLSKPGRVGYFAAFSDWLVRPNCLHGSL